jgi:hypothetical protein
MGLKRLLSRSYKADSVEYGIHLVLSIRAWLCHAEQSRSRESQTLKCLLSFTNLTIQSPLPSPDRSGILYTRRYWTGVEKHRCQRQQYMYSVLLSHDAYVLQWSARSKHRNV